MKEKSTEREPWYTLDDRRLQAQPVFWAGVGIPALLVLGAAGWMLSGYERLWTSQGVEHFFKLVAPLVPWLAFVAGIAALIARMHATVQTEAQIDASRSSTAFNQYLEHRRHIALSIERSSVLSSRPVDLNQLYRCLFPDNSHTYLSLNGDATQGGEKDHILWMENSILSAFTSALDTHPTNLASSKWSFNFHRFERDIRGILKRSGISLSASEMKDASMVFDLPNADHAGRLRLLNSRYALLAEIIQELAYLCGAEKSDNLDCLDSAIFRLDLDEGYVLASYWSVFDYNIDKFSRKLKDAKNNIAQIVIEDMNSSGDDSN